MASESYPTLDVYLAASMSIRRCEVSRINPITSRVDRHSCFAGRFRCLTVVTPRGSTLGANGYGKSFSAILSLRSLGYVDGVCGTVDVLIPQAGELASVLDVL